MDTGTGTDMKRVLAHILDMESKLIAENREMKLQLQGLVEVNARFAQEIIAIKNGGQKQTLSNGFGGSESVDTKPKVRNNKVILKVDGETLNISGNTYAHRSIFGEHGSKWDGSSKTWNTDVENLEDIKKALGDGKVEYEVV